MVTASYRSLRNWADTTGAKSFGRPTLRNWADTTGAKSFGRPSRVRRCPA